MTQINFLQIQTFCQRKTSHTSWKASQCFASFETSLAPWFLWSLLSSHRGAARNTGQELQTLRLHKMKSFVFVFAALALFCLQIWVGYLLRLFLEWTHGLPLNLSKILNISLNIWSDDIAYHIVVNKLLRCHVDLLVVDQWSVGWQTVA